MLHILLTLSLIAPAALAGRPAPATPPAGVPSVAIVKRRTVLVRTGRLAREFPERRRAVVNYPVIRGPQNSEVLRKVRSLLDFKNIFGSSLAEYRQEAWLTEFDYEVNYNRNYILDITFTQEGVGAYPDTHTKHFAINLKNGELIRAADAFNADGLNALAALADKRLQAEIQQTRKEVAEARDADDMYAKLKFETNNLDDFSISAKGVTFLYDAEFPHVIQALEPAGSYFFSYAELKPYIKRDGPLGVFIR